VVALEDRLPPGETLLGLALSAAWLDGPGEAMLDPVLNRPERPPAHGMARTPPAFGDPLSNSVTPTISPPSFAEAPQASDGQAALPGSTTAVSEPFSLAGLLVTPPSGRTAGRLIAASGNLPNVGSAPVVFLSEASGLANSFLAPGADPLKASVPSQTSALAAEPSGAIPDATDLSSANKVQIQEGFGRQPLSFEANVGQADRQVQFLAHGPGYSLYLTSSEAVMVLTPGSGGKSQGSGALGGFTTAATVPATVVSMQVLGGKAGVQAVGEQQLPGIVNYFVGNDPSQWHAHIATYGRVTYPNIYPGIDLAYYGNQQQLEYDFVVAPGANPSQIRLGFSGADQVAVNAQGDLVLHANGQEIYQHKPVVYQDVNGTRQEIPSTFLVSTDHSLITRPVSFALAAYDPSRPLVIDPALSYSTYLGGSASERGQAIAVDAGGNAYIVGSTDSVDFPTTNAFQTGLAGTVNAFVTKIAADGSALLYSTYLGGSGDDEGHGIAVDAAGNAYVTGVSSSSDFPTVNALQPAYGGGRDAFVTKIAADGSALLYSTYLGGSNGDYGSAIAVDAAGNAYVTGTTSSSDFPTTNAFQPALAGPVNAFVTKINADGSALVYSTYLGGSGNDYGTGIAVDGDGNAYVTGYTTSRDFPTANALQPAFGGGVHEGDAFVTKIAADGSALLFSTYLGGSDDDAGEGLAVDADGNAYVTGYTLSSDFPTANAFQPALAGTVNAFVTKVAADGSALLYSTYLGGKSADFGTAIIVDGVGNAYVTGFTSSPNFPTVNAFQPAYGGGVGDAFVAKITTDGSALVYSSYLGGRSDDDGYGIAVDAAGNAYVTGDTTSDNFPTVNPLQVMLGGNGVFKSTSAGADWSGSSTGLTNGDVRALALDPTNPSTIYAGTNGGGVFLSSDAGLNWSASNAGLTNLAIRALVLDPTTPSTIYAGTDGGGVFQSADSGATWNAINTGLTNLSIRAIVIDPATPTTLYAATAANGGVFKSTDDGTTWNASNTGLENAQVVTLAIDPGTPSVLYAGTIHDGVYKSTDGGASWSSSNTGLPLGSSGDRNITALAIDPVTPTTLYAGVGYSMVEYPFVKYQVYKSTDGGASWRSSSSGLSDRSAFSPLAIDPVTPTTLYAESSNGSYGQLYKSLDGGATWSLTGLSPNTAHPLAIDPTTPTTVYAGTVSNDSDAFVTKISP
jgi:hypothetical protein